MEMSIRQAARWAESKDALYIGGNPNNPMAAVWSANTHKVVCLGSADKCRAWIKANTTCQYIPTYGMNYPGQGDWFRMDSLDEVLEGMEQTEAELRLPECDYRSEAWA